MAWYYVAVFAAALVVSFLIKPKVEEDESLPPKTKDKVKADVGTGIPVLFGTRVIHSPNVVWWQTPTFEDWYGEPTRTRSLQNEEDELLTQGQALSPAIDVDLIPVNGQTTLGDTINHVYEIQGTVDSIQQALDGAPKYTTDWWNPAGQTYQFSMSPWINTEIVSDNGVVLVRDEHYDLDERGKLDLYNAPSGYVRASYFYKGLAPYVETMQGGVEVGGNISEHVAVPMIEELQAKIAVRSFLKNCISVDVEPEVIHDFNYNGLPPGSPVNFSTLFGSGSSGDLLIMFVLGNYTRASNYSFTNMSGFSDFGNTTTSSFVWGRVKVANGSESGSISFSNTSQPSAARISIYCVRIKVGTWSNYTTFNNYNVVTGWTQGVMRVYKFGAQSGISVSAPYAGVGYVNHSSPFFNTGIIGEAVFPAGSESTDTPNPSSYRASIAIQGVTQQDCDPAVSWNESPQPKIPVRSFLNHSFSSPGMFFEAPKPKIPVRSFFNDTYALLMNEVAKPKIPVASVVRESRETRLLGVVKDYSTLTPWGSVAIMPPVAGCFEVLVLFARPGDLSVPGFGSPIHIGSSGTNRFHVYTRVTVGDEPFLADVGSTYGKIPGVQSLHLQFADVSSVQVASINSEDPPAISYSSYPHMRSPVRVVTACFYDSNSAASLPTGYSSVSVSGSSPSGSNIRVGQRPQVIAASPTLVANPGTFTLPGDATFAATLTLVIKGN